MGENEIKVDLIMAIDEAIRRLNRIEGTVEHFAKNGETFFGRMNAAWSSFTGNLAANVATKAFDMAANAARKFFNVFVTGGISAAREQEDAVNAINVALYQTGQFAPATSKEMQNLASSLQQTTKYGDETVLSSMALLQSLGNLSSRQLPRATRAAVDMASILKIDLTTAMELVGKAAQGEVGSLSRYGIIMEKGTTNAATLEKLLGLIEQRFGGSAQREINTYSGAVAQTTNEFGELQEATGDFIVRNPMVIQFLKQGAVAFRDATQWVRANQAEILGLVNNGLVGLTKGLGYTLIGLDGVIRFFKVLYQSVVLAADAVAGWNAVVYGSLSFKDFKDQLVQDAKAIADTFSTEGAVGKAGDAVLGYSDKLAGFAATHRDLTGSMGQEFAGMTQNNANNFNSSTDAMRSMAGDFAKDFGNKLGQSFKLFQNGTIDIVGAFNSAIDAMVQKIITSGITDLIAGITGIGGGGGGKGPISGLGIPIVSGIAGIFGFAGGGVIPGNQYFGDKVLARVNSGEVVLTREDQKGMIGIIRMFQEQFKARLHPAAASGDTFQFGTVIGNADYFDNFIIPMLRSAMQTRNKRLW